MAFRRRRSFRPINNPKSIPVGHKRPPTLAEQVARLVRSSQMDQAARAAGLETFEEADDFDVDDDNPLPNTPWEKNFDLPVAHAMDAGIVARPSPEQVARGKTALEKATRALYKRKPAADDTPPAKRPDESSAAPKSQADDSSSSD